MDQTDTTHVLLVGEGRSCAARPALPTVPPLLFGQAMRPRMPRFIAVLSHAQAELREVRRYLLYCRGLKYKKESQQVAFWQEHVQLGEHTRSFQRPYHVMFFPMTPICSHHHRPLVGARPTVQCRAAPACLRADR